MPFAYDNMQELCVNIPFTNNKIKNKRYKLLLQNKYIFKCNTYNKYHEVSQFQIGKKN